MFQTLLLRGMDNLDVVVKHFDDFKFGETVVGYKIWIFYFIGCIGIKWHNIMSSSLWSSVKSNIQMFSLTILMELILKLIYNFSVTMSFTF